MQQTKCSRLTVQQACNQAKCNHFECISFEMNTTPLEHIKQALEHTKIFISKKNSHSAHLLYFQNRFIFDICRVL